MLPFSNEFFIFPLGFLPFFIYNYTIWYLALIYSLAKVKEIKCLLNIKNISNWMEGQNSLSPWKYFD